MPIEGAVIEITYDGQDISNSVVYKTARFESQISAQPGTFEFTVRDPDRTLSFVTGKQISLSVDGVLLYGGYVLQVTRKYALPVLDTSVPVKGRQWVLRGVDYNILFDKRVLHNGDTAPEILEQLPNVAAGAYDGDLVKQLAADYIDVPAGFDTNTNVENILVLNPSHEWAWMQQGSKWREQMTDFEHHSGAIWYFDAAKNLIYRALENSEAKWGFSDVPNKRDIVASPSVFQGAT
jgi:hypothetical protein